MLEASKLVLVDDPDFTGGLHKIARLYHHDLETNEASLLVDKLRIHELRSASVIAMGHNLTSSMIDVQFENQRVKDAFFQQFDFAKLVAANAETEVI